MTKTYLPKHIGFIMDGNGRWATSRGLPRKEGHRAGADALEKIVSAAFDRGIEYITFYGFSTENWSRPIDEVNAIMNIISSFLKKMIYDFDNPTKEVHNNTNVNFLGDMSVFSLSQRAMIKTIEDRSSSFKGKMTLNIAINYGGRADIVNAVNTFIKSNPGKKISESDISARLYTSEQPDPDLIVRTAGEMRLSNFLVWQAAYSEYYSTPVCWPDFDESEFDRAIDDYLHRTRKFGGIEKN